ncbi:hypothetical protein [Pseudomonas sp. MWU13-2105]|uniref:hypothetical protein n=1 Tax=Pseudomonas sp. MWU13-2105 TaxID=2935074 RepID=UPI00200EEDB1|nr:hypothetical protein [Pseudomonas sp. MWU13-2105]
MAQLSELLSMMQGKLMTRGWDAIFSCNRVRLNYLLEQQYITRYEVFSFLPYLSGRTALGEGRDDFAEVKALRLGTPRISFERATSRDSTATVTMNIVSGEIFTWHSQAGAPAQLLSRFPVMEQQGFSVTMTVNLKVVVAEVDRRGRITLDLRGATHFSCDLLGAGEADLLGAFFQAQFDDMEPNQTVFQLGRISLKGYRGLTPKNFRLRTQAEPGAQVKGALNEGDGVVLALIEVRGGTGPGAELGADFPILIPSDLEGGQPKYTASVVVSREVLPLAVGNDLELPESLSFPGQNLFKVLSTHTPFDWLAVGQISPATTSIVVEPRFSAIKAGGQQRFQLLDWQNKPITSGVTWEAVSLRSHSDEGNGEIDSNGLYKAVSSLKIGYHNLDIVVTATRGEYRASALLRVDFEALEVSPAVLVQDVAQQPGITLSAAANDGNNTLSCSLQAPLYGSLQKMTQRSQWMFTANAEAMSRSLSLQRVRCQTSAPSQSVESLLVLNNAQSFLQVEPAFVQRVPGGTSVQLRDDNSVLPDVPRRWRILDGVGTINQEGRYTAPADGVTQTTVLACEVVRNGVVLFRDIALLNRREEAEEPTWEELAQFTIEIPNGLENRTQGLVLRNGYQQLQVRITTRTRGVLIDGEIKYFRLSLDERRSMCLATHDDRQILTIIEPDVEGIDNTLYGAWQMRKTRSSFSLAYPQQPSASLASTQAEDDSLSVQDFYLLTLDAKNSSTTLVAGFQQDKVNDWHWSGERGSTAIGTAITATAIDPPGEFEYSFDRVERLWGKKTGDLDEQMNMELNSGDFWLLKCRGQEFVTLDFLPIDASSPLINLSSIRWESERPAEIMFSYTGSYFESKFDFYEDEYGGKFKFDDDINSIRTLSGTRLKQDVDRPGSYERGTFGMVLCRVDDVSFILPGHAPRLSLGRDLAVALRDENGNLHLRRIRFASREVGISDRNMLDHSKFSVDPSWWSRSLS